MSNADQDGNVVVMKRQGDSFKFVTAEINIATQSTPEERKTQLAQKIEKMFPERSNNEK